MPSLMVSLGAGERPAEAIDAPHYASWSAFLAAPVAAEGFYLTTAEAGQPDGLLRAVRQSAWWDRSVFAPPGTPAHPGLDGTLPWPEASRRCEHEKALRASLGLDTKALHFDERLLYFLYQREPGDLVPLLDRQASQLYRYPVADLLAEPSVHVAGWLTSLTRRGLLEPSQLVDRTRHCQACRSAHLHFIDVCPHCASLHIHKGASLHCFACGHVAPEPEFMGDRGLQCPKCSARLRHIGVDYDRPLTQYTCSQCHHAFIDAAVRARCLDCGASQAPEALSVHEVAVLRLSLRGRAALRAGQVSDTFAALEGIGFTPLETFRFLVDWALVTQARHPEMQFALVMVELTNAVALLEAHGPTQTYQRLDEFARRLRELLRTSDVSTRTSEDRLWLFLPYASAEGFAARLHRLVEPGASGDGLRLRIGALTAPREIRPQERADTLMARIQEET